MQNGASLFNHAARLNDEGELDQAIELIERVEAYQTGALEMLYELATERTESKSHALITITPAGDNKFVAEVKEADGWREFASGPFSELLKAIVALGYSTARLEERYLVPLPKDTVKHTFLLDSLKTA